MTFSDELAINAVTENSAPLWHNLIVLVVIILFSHMGWEANMVILSNDKKSNIYKGRVNLASMYNLTNILSLWININLTRAKL